MACSANCPTRDHESYGQCLRSKGIQIDRHALANDHRLEVRKDRALARYADMRRSGLQPEAPTKTAMDKTEAAYG